MTSALSQVGARVKDFRRLLLYENIRIVFKRDLSWELSQGSLKDLVYTGNTSYNTLDQDEVHITRESCCQFDITELNKFMKI